jgi:hypothetical protein
MSRSPLSKSGTRYRRLAVLAPACVLATTGILTLAGPASASGTASATSAPLCSNATLHGTYTFASEGWTVTKSASTPSSTAGFDNFNGAGTSTGVASFTVDGATVNNNTPDTATYTLKTGCTGKIVYNNAGSLAHFDIYASPSGQSFSFVETDPGSVLAGTETRVS